MALWTFASKTETQRLQKYIRGQHLELIWLVAAARWYNEGVTVGSFLKPNKIS